MIIADRVFREEPPASKVHISGTFSGIYVSKFPCFHPSLHVYVAFTDTRPGTHKAKFRFVYLDENQTELMTTEGPLNTTDPLQVNELNVGFNGVPLLKEGVLAVEFWLDGEPIGSRKIHLKCAPAK